MGAQLLKKTRHTLTVIAVVTALAFGRCKSANDNVEIERDGCASAGSEKLDEARDAVALPGLRFVRAAYLPGEAFAITPQDVSACERGEPGHYDQVSAYLGDLGGDGTLDVAVVHYSAPPPFGTPLASRFYALDLSSSPPTLRARADRALAAISPVGIADLDEDGEADILTREVPWYSSAGGFVRGTDWPGGTVVYDSPSVSKGLLGDERFTVVTQRGACMPGRQVSVLARVGQTRQFVDASGEVPETEPIDIQSVDTAVFPSYRAISFAGFHCPSGPPAPSLLLADTKGDWRLEDEKMLDCGSAMGVLFGERFMYRTCDPDVYLHELREEGRWARVANPFQVTFALDGSAARPWGVIRASVAGHDVIFVAHGPDDGCRPDYVRGELSNINAYAKVNGEWVRLDLSDLTSDRSNWRWLRAASIGGRTVIAAGTIGNDPRGGSVGGGMAQIYVSVP